MYRFLSCSLPEKSLQSSEPMSAPLLWPPLPPHFILDWSLNGYRKVPTSDIYVSHRGGHIHVSTAHPGQSAGRRSPPLLSPLGFLPLAPAAEGLAACQATTGPKRRTAGPLPLLPPCHFLTLPIPPQVFPKQVTALQEMAFSLQLRGSFSCIPTSVWTQIQTRAPGRPPHLLPTPTARPQSRKG